MKHCLNCGIDLEAGFAHGRIDVPGVKGETR